MSRIEPKTYSTKTGETIVIRCATARDAAHIVALRDAIVEERLYTLAGPGERTLTD